MSRWVEQDEKKNKTTEVEVKAMPSRTRDDERAWRTAVLSIRGIAFVVLAGRAGWSMVVRLTWGPLWHKERHNNPGRETRDDVVDGQVVFSLVIYFDLYFSCRKWCLFFFTVAECFLLRKKKHVFFFSHLPKMMADAMISVYIFFFFTEAAKPSSCWFLRTIIKISDGVEVYRISRTLLCSYYCYFATRQL